MLRLTSMCVSCRSNQKPEERNKGRSNRPFLDAFERRAHRPGGEGNPRSDYINQWPTGAPQHFLTRLTALGSKPPGNQTPRQGPARWAESSNRPAGHSRDGL